MGLVEDFQKYCVLLNEEGYKICGGTQTTYSLEKKGSTMTKVESDIKKTCKKCAINGNCRTSTEDGVPPTIYADLNIN